jgi:Holliday junction resolvasome RuvABC endonuclease subunit
MQRQRLLAVDPSLTCSGWACFDVKTDRVLAVGKIRSKGPESPLAERLEDLQAKILRVMEELKIGPRDLVVCEAPTTMRDPRAAIKVEQVRCIFEVLARSLKAQVPGRINPRTVHHELLGLRGRQAARLEVKRAAVQVAQQLFGEALETLGFEPTVQHLSKHQDIVDALLLGYIGLTRVRSARWADTPLEELMHRRAFKKTALRG